MHFELEQQNKIDFLWQIGRMKLYEQIDWESF